MAQFEILRPGSWNNRGRIVTKEELLETVWAGVCVDEGTIAQRISVLRRTLGEAEDGRPYIETIPRCGYRFAASVTESCE